MTHVRRHFSDLGECLYVVDVRSPAARTENGRSVSHPVSLPAERKRWRRQPTRRPAEHDIDRRSVAQSQKLACRHGRGGQRVRDRDLHREVFWPAGAVGFGIRSLRLPRLLGCDRYRLAMTAGAGRSRWVSKAEPSSSLCSATRGRDGGTARLILTD